MLKNQRILRTLIFGAIIGCLSIPITAKKLTSFPAINMPYYFEVYDQQVYIGEESTISIYSLKNFTLIKKFGRRGEGPGEFKSLPMFKVYPKYLVVDTFGKWLLFSREGDFIEEKNNTLFKRSLCPVGKNFIAYTVNPRPKSKEIPKVISILDKDLQPIKEIARMERKLNTGGRRIDEAITDFFRFSVYGDKIFLGDTTKGFYIAVFDCNGNKLYDIKKQYPRLKVTEEYKKEFLKRRNESKDFVRKTLKKLRYKVVFRDYFPAFKNFKVKDDKIYAFTYKNRGRKNEIVVMNLKGEVLKKVFVTMPRSSLDSVSSNKYFYLEENETTEEWELFEEDI